LEGSGKGASLSAEALLGEPRGGAPFLRIWKDMGRRAQGTSLSVEAPLGNLAGGSSKGDLRRLWRWAPFSTGPVNNLRGVCSPGTLR